MEEMISVTAYTLLANLLAGDCGELKLHKALLGKLLVRMIWVLLLCALFAGLGEATGATLTVRKDGTGNYTTIQSAVNAMAARDTCLVGPGAYAERISFPGGRSGQAGSLTTVMAETSGTAETLGF